MIELVRRPVKENDVDNFALVALMFGSWTEMPASTQTAECIVPMQTETSQRYRAAYMMYLELFEDKY